ncbi:hypothetical protein ASG01_14480 [Chryseobacterium sp. Leaf180]|uniref:DUF4249 domain-containing protein n=1 Tax=Chryseobacterium sp. Leaf180 TaxID=1736289 RepID=UPI0006FB2DC5|nr:DUF4249 domain-containing protein [Chryseobacterium sp. Leaf180]KQR91088.1 hypothetical protein ASG01_14480 [Chryseobacterium sp. Leaf180]
MKKFFFLYIFFFLINSCEKEIDLDLDDISGDLVIEGNLSDQAGPHTVKITQSVPFTAQNQYPFVSDAVVTVSDDIGQTETLQYAGNGEYKTANFTTSPGKLYTLNIKAKGKEYTAQSRMPQPVSFDGLDQDSFFIGGEPTYTLLPLFTDPQEFGNRYLFSLTINNNPKKTLQTFSDNFNNGILNQRPLILPNNDANPNDQKVKVGDLIHVEMQCIDASIFTFYNALLQISGNGGPGGGITPTNPPSNISNGALGYFSAHTSRKQSIVIQ